MNKICKGDKVQILSGNDKGKTGEVLEVLPKTQKILVKGVNVRKKHVKARKQGQESGILSVESPIYASKAAVVCPKCGKATKVGFTMEKDGKVRICKKCSAKLK
jgi:large subunit ribosomal protein L24